MSIRIVSLRKNGIKEESGEVVIRCDRRSALGNPFYMHSESARDSVCDKYEVYFKRQIVEEGALREAVKRIYRIHKAGRDVALACWCAPKRCHCETIKRFVESQDV